MLEKLWKKFLRRGGLSLWALPVPVMALLSLLYRLGLAIDRRWPRRRIKVDVPVISVGNISVGGTGKTPVVAMLARLLIDEGYRVGVVSSGWGRHDDTPFVEEGYKVQRLAVEVTGDEVHCLAGLLPDAFFSVDRSKTDATEKLVANCDVDVIIVDDGFQHYRLVRDLDIVTYDAAIDTRNLRIFPLGILREPHSALKRADVILITRANFTDDITQVRQEIKRINPRSELYHAQFLASELIGRERNLSVKYLGDKSVFLFAGVGNFDPLRRQVDALAGDLDEALELSDHQVYTTTLLENIAACARAHDSDVIVTTGKDWVKLRDFDFGREIYYLAQSIDLDPGEEKLAIFVQQRLDLCKRKD